MAGCTTFHLTLTMKYVQDEILRQTGLSKPVFQRLAFEEFFAGDPHVDEQFKKNRWQQGYTKKPVLETIRLDDETRDKLLEIANKEGCGITIVIFQAMFDYCLKCIEDGYIKLDFQLDMDIVLGRKGNVADYVNLL